MLSTHRHRHRHRATCARAVWHNMGTIDAADRRPRLGQRARLTGLSARSGCPVTWGWCQSADSSPKPCARMPRRSINSAHRHRDCAPCESYQKQYRGERCGRSAAAARARLTGSAARSGYPVTWGWCQSADSSPKLCARTPRQSIHSTQRHRNRAQCESDLIQYVGNRCGRSAAAARATRTTHRNCSAVRLPSDVGMVPVS